MRSSLTKCLGGWLGTALLLMLLTTAARAGEQADEPTRHLAPPASAETVVEVEEGVGEAIQVPDRWVGLGCQPVPDLLRAQLPLEEGQGLLVEMVAEGSPGEEVGFKRYDVLVTADGKALGAVQDLIDAVAQAGDKMAFEVLRGGQKKTIEVTPADRPEHARPGRPPHAGTPPEEFQQWLERPRGEDDEGRRFQFRFYGPGAILPPRVHVETPLPGNLSVTVTKKGDQPAKVVVNQNGDTWEVTEETLGELPDNIREHAKRYLGRPRELRPGRVQVWDLVPDWLPPGREFWAPPGLRNDLKEQLDDMKRQLEEMDRRLQEQHESPAEPDTDDEAEKRV